ncbi:MAG: AMP-binding protein, partial [Pseudomonadota bacterium]
MTKDTAMKQVPFDVDHARIDLFAGLIRASKDYGPSRVAVIDGDGRKLTYKEVIRAAFALGSALKAGTNKGDNVGILLPTGVGAIIAFYAVLAYGRVPAMLNFTAGSKNIKSAMKAAKIKRIVTAHKFIEIGALEPLIEELKSSGELIYLEDVREGLSLGNKAAGALGPALPWLFRSNAHHTKPGVILFTSGTEGEPKGVVLSHENVMANVDQVRAHIALDPATDSVFNPLPTFHCFGLTVGAVLPLISGVKAICHPSPLQPREIAKRVRKTGSTILLATDTFISQYARAGSEGDLDSVRLAVCGAERVRDETRQLVRKKFNIEILEGYGATEAAPVIAANQIGANKAGTVGMLMAGMEHDLVPVEGIEEGGRLRVRGPNVMQGYLRASNPGIVEQT